jgi:hypothetical protein
MPSTPETVHGTCWIYYPHVSAPRLPPMPPSPFAAVSPELQPGKPQLAQALRSATSCPLALPEIGCSSDIAGVNVAAAESRMQQQQQQQHAQQQQRLQQPPRPGTAVGFYAATQGTNPRQQAQQPPPATFPQQQQQVLDPAAGGAESPWACPACRPLAHRGSRSRAHSISINSSSSSSSRSSSIRLATWGSCVPSEGFTKRHAVACIQLTQVRPALSVAHQAGFYLSEVQLHGPFSDTSQTR